MTDGNAAEGAGTPLLRRLTPAGAPSPETEAFNAALEAALAGAPAIEAVDIDAVRRLRAEGKAIMPVHGPRPGSEWVSFDAAALAPPGLDASGAPAQLRLSAPAKRTPRAVIAHLHGGGWTFGSAEQFDARQQRLAEATGALSVSIAYRLAPEHRWPACADDALLGVLWALEEAERRGGLPVFLGGESAGAHLATVTMLRLRALGRIDAISGAFLTYGCFDLGMTPSLRNWGRRNLVLSTPIVRWFSVNLLGDDYMTLRSDPAVSPLWADLSGLPPALFQVGDLDPLLDDTLFLAERWAQAGAPAELAVWPGAVHGFDSFDRPQDKLPIALESQALTARYLNDWLG